MNIYRSVRELYSNVLHLDKRFILIFNFQKMYSLHYSTLRKLNRLDILFLETHCNTLLLVNSFILMFTPLRLIPSN